MSPQFATLLAQSSDAGAFAGMGAMVILLWVLAAAVALFWVWMLIDCLSSPMPTNEKLLWALVILLGAGIGALLYFFIKRGNRTAVG